MRRDAVAAALVPGEVGAVEQENPQGGVDAQCTERRCGSGGARADHDDVPRVVGGSRCSHSAHVPSVGGPKPSETPHAHDITDVSNLHPPVAPRSNEP